jgi:hypothetical protein
VRTLIRPVLNLFHGERGGKRWKQAVDEALRTRHPATVSELMDATLSQVPDDVLDAPPRSAAASAAMANNGVAPPPYALQGIERLAVGEDRARGEREPQRKPKKGSKAWRQLQQQEQAGSGSEEGEGEQAAGTAVVQQPDGAQLSQQQPSLTSANGGVAALVAGPSLSAVSTGGEVQQEQQQQSTALQEARPHEAPSAALV